MPDLHVDFLLQKYRNYLEERMLDSGRLSKGTYNEIANDLNKKFSVHYYEREQVRNWTGLKIDHVVQLCKFWFFFPELKLEIQKI